MRWLIVMIMFPIAVLAADLNWQPLQQEVRAVVDQERLEARYTVTNVGSLDQRITDLAVNCDCAGVDASLMTIPPGGSSVITCAYNVGDRRGTHRKQITVTLERADGQVSQQRLDLAIVIPEPIKPARTVIFWRRGGKVTAQRLPIRIDEPAQHHVLRIDDLPAGISAELEPQDDGSVVCVLTPLSVDVALTQRIYLVTDHPSPSYARIPVVVMIK